LLQRIAIGLKGEAAAPVIGKAGATTSHGFCLRHMVLFRRACLLMASVHDLTHTNVRFIFLLRKRLSSARMGGNQAMSKTIPSCAVTGHRTTLKQHAGLPCTPGQIATAGLDAANAGEAIATTRNRQSAAYAWYVMLILTACYTLAFIDFKIPFILVQLIKQDLSLTDTQMGILTGPAFSLTYGICGIPLAKLSDRFGRKYIIVGAVTVWSAFTASCGVAHSFASFTLGRVGVALGESTLTPAAHSMIADYFPERQRAKVMAIYFSGIALGSFLALAVGGSLADHYGWRSAMYAVGATGMVLSLLVLTTVREPVREHNNAARKLSEGGIVALFADPAIRNTIIGATLLTIAIGSMAAWSPAYIMRTFGMSASATGATYGTLTGLLSLTGTLLGGFLASWFSRQDIRYGHRFLAIAFLVAAPFNIISLCVGSYSLFLLFGATTGLLMLCYLGPTYATIQSFVEPGSRSFAAAVTLFCTQGVGLAGGAFLTGWLSDQFAGQFGPNSLRWSMGVMSLMSIWAAFHYWAASNHMDRRPAAS
jgi:predicted MFS family arabinose efflux permease